jgi:hypothetical protein
MATSIIQVMGAVSTTTVTAYTCPTGKRAKVQVISFLPPNTAYNSAGLSINSNPYTPAQADRTAHHSTTHIIVYFNNGNQFLYISGGSSLLSTSSTAGGVAASEVKPMYLAAGDTIRLRATSSSAYYSLNIIEEDI